jgi:hypothetical protein
MSFKRSFDGLDFDYIFHPGSSDFVYQAVGVTLLTCLQKTSLLKVALERDHLRPKQQYKGLLASTKNDHDISLILGSSAARETKEKNLILNCPACRSRTLALCQTNHTGASNYRAYYGFIFKRNATTNSG